MLLFDRLKSKGVRLILASQSPRRQQLMQGAGLEFDVVRYEVDESYPGELPAAEVPEFLARLKSENYPHELKPNEVLITADTVVIMGDEILGKPLDKEQAKEMLGKLSAKKHKVVTGVSLRTGDKQMSFSCKSSVTFAKLTQQEIDHYVEKYMPLDKAGSYGIQEWIGYIGIEGIEGSFYNVMGLPIQKLYTKLNKFIAQ